MSIESMHEELVTASMEIILSTGDARNALADALKEAKKSNFEEAERKLSEAKELATEAHKSQTGIIQNEASGKQYPHSMLFTHAQDHLMTINSEMKFTSELVDILRLIDQRFNKEGEVL